MDLHLKVRPLIAMHLIGRHVMSMKLMSRHLMGMQLMDMHLIGMHLIGMHLIGMHLIGMHLIGRHLIVPKVESGFHEYICLLPSIDSRYRISSASTTYILSWVFTLRTGIS